MKKKDKVYCGQCKHHDRSDYCPANPETLSMEYFAPGATTLYSELCAVKNRDNNCSDFKKK